MSEQTTIYICGVHGTGKTTLIRKLKAKCNSIVVLPRKPVDITLEKPYERALMRIVKYYLEAEEHIKIQRNSESKMFVGDRCVLDTLAYAHGYRDLGWIDQKESENIASMAKLLFTEHLQPSRVLLLDPPLDWVMNNLCGRWKTNGVGWREDNIEYLSAIMNAYRAVIGQGKHRMKTACRVENATALDTRVIHIKEMFRIRSKASAKG